MLISIDRDKVTMFMMKNGIKTNTELAAHMGITKNQLSNMLSSRFDPIKSNVHTLAKALDTDVSMILTTEKINKILLKSFDERQLEFEFIEDNGNYNNKYSSTAIKYIDISNIKPNKKYTSVELFAGAGGLALGLEEAGFHNMGLVEIDKHCCDTLRLNRPNWNVLCEDIIKVADKGIRDYIEDCEIDLLSGGYPCQSFSYAGKKLGLNDIRGTMFYYFAEVLKDLRPKMFFAENVKGLLSHDNGRTLNTMIDVFSDIGYKVKKHIIRAIDYGIAQKRERIAIIGVRADLDKHEFRYPQPFGYIPTLRDALKDVPESIGESYPQSKKLVLDQVPPGGYWRDLPESVAKSYMGKSYYSGGGRTGMARRISWDEPSLTLTCSPAQKQTERCHPDETRPFTVREYARIQSFPDEWIFTGSMGEQYKQIGNAVPVDLARAMGNAIINTLNNISDLP